MEAMPVKEFTKEFKQLYKTYDKKLKNHEKEETLTH
jgi:hypothetical protein